MLRGHSSQPLLMATGAIMSTLNNPLCQIEAAVCTTLSTCSWTCSSAWVLPHVVASWPDCFPELFNGHKTVSQGECAVEAGYL